MLVFPELVYRLKSHSWNVFEFSVFRAAYPGRLTKNEALRHSSVHRFSLCCLEVPEAFAPALSSTDSVTSLFSSPMIQSLTSARLQTNSCSLWWSGPRESLTSLSCRWMTKSFCSEPVRLSHSHFAVVGFISSVYCPCKSKYTYSLKIIT